MTPKNPVAEPKIVAAHGTAVAGRQSKPGITLSKLIEDAQIKAIFECHAADVTNPDKIKEAKAAARAKAKADWAALLALPQD